ncbi:MAG: cupin domain-containing protein [Chloroflexi bacterium]|nr:cupin domain-containing protein [Chloroflexota bacterium]MCI0577727.1 cupin domain-containing protein [Chloroflexota bacterium]MCI0644011.1 cupin domain-containing protein [Chloroflexota bacterium]MCI0731990.1 cupin domain-containing protein [Chloroflexota bacterium]
MELVKALTAHVGTRPEKFYKTTLFQSQALLLGLNCLEPGQVQEPHDHAGQDKFYYVVEGQGRFWLGNERVTAAAGDVLWAPAGLSHGVANEGQTRLTLLVGIAPAP